MTKELDISKYVVKAKPTLGGYDIDEFRASKDNDINKSNIEITLKNDGDWNRGCGKKVIGKCLAHTKFNNGNDVLRHNDILYLINKHIEADEKNIKSILDPTIDTGNITKIELPFRYKLFNFLIDRDLKYCKEKHILFLKQVIQGEKNAYVDENIPCIVWKGGSL